METTNQDLLMHYRHTEPPASGRNDWQTLRALMPYLWDYRGRAGLALLFLVLARLANVGVPVALKEIVDDLSRPGMALVALPVALIVAYGLLRLGSSAFNELRDIAFARVRYGTMRIISTTLLARLHDLSLRYHLERKTGAITRDLERGTASASSLLNYMVFNIIPTFVEFLLIATFLLFKYSVWFAVVTFVTVTVYVAYTFVVTEWRMRYRHRMNMLDSQANSQAVDSLINYETVKYFGNEKLEHRRYDATLRDWEEAAIKAQTSLSSLNVGQGSIIAVGVTLIMVLAAQEVQAGRMTIGDLVLVNAFMLQMFQPLNFLGVVYSQLKHALADMEQMFALLQCTPEIRDRPDAATLRADHGAVRFDHVHFGYSSERPILYDVDFEILPGRKVAVVGHSGAGKSTLSRLLFRFYDVNGGRVLIDGHDVRDVTQASLRAAIGIVPQDTVLFNDTIEYNLAYGCPGATRDQIERAARIANIHDFIVSLPLSYATVVGERGLKLSGGEKQRVAIARAILKNPRVMVFDEATSSLDTHSEKLILDALQQAASDHTTLVIAHRLSTVVDADQILVMEQGRIVERGTHHELLTRDGIYARMWALQQEEQSTQPSSPPAMRSHPL
jgi:ATP-binding cassette subfamily B protein